MGSVGGGRVIGDCQVRPDGRREWPRPVPPHGRRGRIQRVGTRHAGVVSPTPADRAGPAPGRFGGGLPSVRRCPSKGIPHCSRPSQFGLGSPLRPPRDPPPEMDADRSGAPDAPSAEGRCSPESSVSRSSIPSPARPGMAGTIPHRPSPEFGWFGAGIRRHGGTQGDPNEFITLGATPG